MPEATAELSPAADHLTVLLQRAPDGLEKAELLDEAGLDPKTFRNALAELERHGLLDGDAEGYRLRPGEEGAERVDGTDAEHTPEAEGEGAGEDPVPAGVSLPPASGPSYRATYRLVQSFGAARGKNRDKAAVARASSLATTMAQALAEVGYSAEIVLEAVEAFDAPRQVYERESSDERAD